MGHLNGRHDRAITALLSSTTIQEAANKADLDRSTLYRYLDDSDFERKYREARRKALNQAIGQLHAGAVDAVETLQEIMHDEDAKPADRIRAAKLVLKFAMKGAELEDLQDRLADLEEVLL